MTPPSPSPHGRLGGSLFSILPLYTLLTKTSEDHVTLSENLCLTPPPLPAPCDKKSIGPLTEKNEK